MLSELGEVEIKLKNDFIVNNSYLNKILPDPKWSTERVENK